MTKTIIKTLGIAVLVLLAVVAVRTEIAFDNRQPQPLKAQQPAIDEQAALERLGGAIRIQTVSYDSAKQTDLSRFAQFHQFLAQSFPLVEQRLEKTTVNRHSLIFHLKGQDPSLKPVLLLAHQDVVPVDVNTLNEWQQAPFSGAVSENGVYGRGAIDDKSGIMGIFEAMESLLKQNRLPKRDVYLAFGHDEEVGGEQGAAKIADWFRQKGIRFEFVLDEGGAITEGMMQGFDRPVALIGVAEKGFVNLNLSVEAEGGHASQPPKHTAVGILSQAIVAIENHPFSPSLDFMNMTFDAIGAEASLPTRAIMANLWLTSPLVESVMMSQAKLAASLHTTMAPTMFSGSDKSNVLPSKATAVVNARIFPGQTYQSVQHYAEEVIDDDRVSVTTSMSSNPSAVSSVDSDGYRLIAGAIASLDPRYLVALPGAGRHRQQVFLRRRRKRLSIFAHSHQPENGQEIARHR